MHNHAAPDVGGVSPHAPKVVFDDNRIVGNDISENSQDFEDAATAGPTGINIFSVAPMTGTLVSENSIHQEAYDIVVNVPATDSGPVVLVHLNNLAGRVGLQDLSGASVDAVQDWWGCSGGPDANGCAMVLGTGAVSAPWLSQPFAGYSH